MIEVFNKHKDTILNSISRFRSKKNLTVFLFSLDLIKNALQGKTNLKNDYLWDGASRELIIDRLTDSDVICLNDTSAAINIYENQYRKDFFISRVNDICKYELNNISTYYSRRKKKFNSYLDLFYTA